MALACRFSFLSLPCTLKENCMARGESNNRYWGTENSRFIHQRRLHSPKVFLGCAISATGPGHYCGMLGNFFVPALDWFGLQHIWVQQDGASAHTASMSQMEDWAPRPPYLTAPRILLMGLLEGEGLCQKANDSSRA